MRGIARIFVFTAALGWGACAVSLFGDLTPGSGLSDCVVDLSPDPVASSQPPKGVRIMYDGWQSGSDEEDAAIRLVIHNGLDLPVYYKAFTPTYVLPEVRIDGKKFDQWTCQNGIEEFQIAPGASAEILATRWDFPRDIAPNAKATVGLYLNLSPSHLRPETKHPDILAITEPFTIPEDFRTARLP